MAETEQFDYETRWRELAMDTHSYLKERSDLSGRELTHTALLEALKIFLLECYSFDIRCKEGRPWAPLAGRKGAELKAVQLHHWLPSEVENMKDEELFFALHSEVISHTFPPEVYEAVKGMFGQYGALPYIHHLAPEVGSTS